MAAPILNLNFDAVGHVFLPVEAEVPLVQQMAEIESRNCLVYLLRQGKIQEFLASLKNNNQYAILNAVEFCAKHGWIPELNAALNELSIRSGLSLIQHLQVSHPSAIPSLVDHPAYNINTEDIQLSLEDCSINPECLRALIRCPRGRCIMYDLKAPSTVGPIDGWGFSHIVLQRNAIKIKYAEVLREEKEMVRAHYWRVMFWSGVVMRLRMQQFQSRYWGPGGPGYILAKASFEAMLKNM